MHDCGGNFGIITAILLPVLLAAAGGTVDLYAAYSQKLDMQATLDAAVLAAAHQKDETVRSNTVTSFISTYDSTTAPQAEDALKLRLAVETNSDGSLSAEYQQKHNTDFLGLIGISTIPIEVRATAIANGTEGTAEAPACIHVLGKQNQAVLINSGANLRSKACRINVESTAAPAFIMNAGAHIETAKFCVRGTSYIKNGGTLANLEVGCLVPPDPYAGNLPQPNTSGVCANSGTRDGKNITLEPGIHCNLTFNGSPTITFKPGLHIIKGRMIANSGSTIIANGVTFYFPDVDSELRANGGLSLTATAPTNGPYKGILMFEPTDSNGAKRQYVFNGSMGETLEGIIYLPNRDVTYNSTTNQTSRISMVVNTMIMNSANWNVEPLAGGAGSNQTSTQSVRLLR
ncbi:TadE/TadG family type IV pilus assembly protein [Rhizobium sp. FY34]|uniref:TadE/TadG family type IV pilus assembly protein n=1 Tax=Rhizobium sp. FY34 TaxID=2562309 RepID=UPI001FF05860|nr:TadE/TadG family type IV pilus assembly protein [Rhizobium sp. FY34]